MKNQIPATLSVALPTGSTLRKITLVASLIAIVFVFSFAGVSHSDVKFSKPVVMLKGTVYAEQTGKVYSVKVSIRSSENTDQEITSSVSNSETGNYLVILAPNTKYLVRLQNAAGVIKEESILTPTVTTSTIQVNKDFTVKTISAK
ncbi:MAG: hypothetical protein ACHQM6_02545 [Candidatus Kapaibacterium sp.]